MMNTIFKRAWDGTWNMKLGTSSQTIMTIQKSQVSRCRPLIEELTLYQIQLLQRLERTEADNQQLKKRMKKLEESPTKSEP